MRYSDGRTEPRVSASRLANPSDDCLTAHPDNDEYQGQCRRDFDQCISDCSQKIEADERSKNTEAVACLNGCFEQFDKLCAQDCLADGVLTVCARRPDLTSCRPTPWCRPRSDWPSEKPHSVRDRPAGLVPTYSVRGGHFQTATSGGSTDATIWGGRWDTDCRVSVRFSRGLA